MCAGTHGGHTVEVEGSFDNWATRHSLQRSGRDFTLVKLLAPGVYQVFQTIWPYFLCREILQHGHLTLKTSLPGKRGLVPYASTKNC